MSNLQTLSKPEKCVIYCRVSTSNQVKDGHGLESQEALCRKWAANNNVSVERVFVDAGKSGKSIENRDELEQMVQFLKRTKQPHIVLIFDLQRLSREVTDFGLIRRQIEEYGHILATCEGILDKSPEEHLITSIQVANGQFFREKNAERVKEFMKARVREGYWQFQQPWGLKFVGRTKQKDLIADEPAASIIRQAIEGYATAKLETVSEVRNFINERRRALGLRDYTMTQTTDMLKNRMYTACFPYEKWGIPTQVWAHIEPLIDTETFQMVQDRLNGRKRFHKNKYNKDNALFPLKGYVVCEMCGRPLTGSFSTGRHGRRYGYYQCQKSGCPGRKQMYIGINTMHADFEQLLSQMEPSKNDIALIRAITLQLYNERRMDKEKEFVQKEKRIQEIEEEINKLFINYNNATNPTIKSLCEQNIDRLTTEKETLKMELENKPEINISFEQALNAVLCVVSSPLEVWNNSDLSLKRTVLNICFPHKLSYSKAEKFRTPEIAPIFKLSCHPGGHKSYMVPVVGLEPTTL